MTIPEATRQIVDRLRAQRTLDDEHWLARKADPIKAAHHWAVPVIYPILEGLVRSVQTDEFRPHAGMATGDVT